MDKTIREPSLFLAVRFEHGLHRSTSMNRIDKKKHMYVKPEKTIDFYNLNNKEKDLKLSPAFFNELFDNDLRIKNVHELKDEKVLEFFEITGAIKFYNQFTRVLDLYFINEYLILHKFNEQSQKLNALCYSKCSENINFSKTERKVVEKFTSTKIDKRNEPNLICKTYTATEMKEQIESYNKLKHFYSKTDSAKVKTLLDAGKTDILNKNIKELCVGLYTNVVVQEKIEKMSSDEITHYLKILGSDISVIACTKYGAYVIQKLIAVVNSETNKRLLCALFMYNAHHLITHDIGNYSIQKILRYNNNEMNNVFIENIHTILTDKIGARVFCKNIDFFREHKQTILNALKQTSMNETTTIILDYFKKSSDKND